MQKNLSAFISLLIVVTVFLTACNKQQKEKPHSTATSKTEISFQTNSETTTEENTSDERDETSTDVEENFPVSDPTRKPEEPSHPNATPSLMRPQKILFYSDGKAQELISEMIVDVMNEINEEFSENYFQQLKLAVTSEDISELKENNYCLELQYNSTQTIQANCDCIDPPTYSFEKILIVLNGKKENIFFLEKDGVYQNGPIGFANSNLSKDILDDIFND